MKLRIFAIATLTSIFSLLNTTETKAQSMLTYSKLTNQQIGITPINAIGQNYEIRSAKGKLIKKGKITNSSTFYISTKDFLSGTYIFSINGESLQLFSIN